MRRTPIMTCAAAGLALISCQKGPSSNAQNQSSNALATGGGPANMICMFKPGETRNWAATVNPNGSITVTGQAHVSNPKYRAKLFNHQVSGSVARVYVTQAENSTGIAPSDGWWDVTPYTIPDNGSIQTVEIWCDMDTKFAQIPVRRGAAGAAAANVAATEVHFQGCPMVVNVEKPGGCLNVKSTIDGKTYEIDSAQPRPDPARGLVIDGIGLAGGIMSICMTGTPLKDIKWHYTKSKCSGADTKQ